MKTIGFIDYYLSEWHANNYPIWIKDLGEDFQIRYAWAEEYVSPVDGRNTDEWCRDFGAEKCDTIDELCQKSDYIVILAPSNPEKHLAYAKAALPYKKRTYIDKTFAPDFETTQTIFNMSNTEFFSTSALRYATELSGLEQSRAVITTGGGSNFDEYIVHQIEMAVKTIQEKPTAVRMQIQGSQIISSVQFENGKSAQMLYAPTYPFTINADTKNGESVYRQIQSDIFPALMADILHFFKTGEISFDPAQTLDVMKIRGALIECKAQPDEWRQIK